MKQKKRVNAIPSADDTVKLYIELCKKLSRAPDKGEFLKEYKNRTKNWVNVIHKHFGKWKTMVGTAAEKSKYVSQLLTVSGGGDKLGAITFQGRASKDN